MTDKKSSESRRKLLKSIAAGSGAIVAAKSLPESWSKPVVDSVMLPVHAQTSPSQSIFFGASQSDNGANHSIQPDSLFADVIDTVVPNASAQQEQRSTLQAHVCITDVGNGNVDVDAVIEFTPFGEDSPVESALFSAQGVPANGEDQDLTQVASGCDDASLIDKLGLIQDAYAGKILDQEASISISLLGTSAMGEVKQGDYTMPYSVSGTECDLPGLVCEPR